MHVHSNPDIRRRAYDDFELMEAAIGVGARAIVIKSHQGTTMDRAYLCNRHNELVHKGSNDFTMFGSITLNRQVGGINPAAVDSALRLGAKVVWLPTQSARNHMKQNKQNPIDCVDVIENGKIVPQLKDVFRLVKDSDAVLGTAHLSPDECFRVVEAARDAGIEKIVVTHPEWWLVGMSLEDQVRIVRDYDVFLEHCFAQPMGGGKYQSNMPVNLEAIEACGYKNVIISTDGGQVENPNWEIALEQYMTYLLEQGIPLEEIHYMTHTIQERLLGITN
ncbi:DUF6282 family protein [Lacrimispora sp.]|uniref:DUF6282 family protein n=1 Tax=Lacrimispora sp. TaxID=2719234 RepID=UPI00346002DA